LSLSQTLLQWHDSLELGIINSIDSTVESYISTKIDEVRLAYSDMMLSFLGTYISDSCDHYVGYVNELKTMIGSRFSYTEIPETEGMDFFDKTIAEYLGNQLSTLVGSVELRLYHELVGELGGYEKAMADNSFIHHYLPEGLRTVAQIELSSGAARLEIDEALTKSGLSESVITDWIKTMETKAEPMLDECGGSVRQAVCLPAHSTSNIVAECFQGQSTRSELCKATFGDVILVSETEDVPLANVAFRLLQARPDCIELTKRLHTRSDVEWLTLEDIL